MKRLLSILLVALLATNISANDTEYTVVGNQLVPLQESDISVAREVLTITLEKGNVASVDVWYEFMNRGKARTILMGFEADLPYPGDGKLAVDARHPNMQDFRVEMNGKALAVRNEMAMSPITGGYKRVTDEWLPWINKDVELHYEGDALLNTKTDSMLTGFCYAYTFQAPFQKGRNIVHHTYRYEMGGAVYCRYLLPYKLTPATHWAGGEIADFTLRIIDENGGGFCLRESNLPGMDRQAKQGECYRLTETVNDPESTYLYATEFSSMEWHREHFRPEEELTLFSSDFITFSDSPLAYGGHGRVVLDEKGNEVGCYLGRQGDEYLIEVQDYGLVPVKGHKVVEYNAEDGQGWVVPHEDEVKVYETPSLQAKVIATLKTEPGDMPEAHRCLGRFTDKEYDQWYIISVGGKRGYVRWQDMFWNAINVY